MAKPIEATPTLHGQEANTFLNNFFKESINPSPERIKTINRANNRNFRFVD